MLILNKNDGMTLMSVMVSAALMGVVALAFIRLFANQDIVIRTVALRDERIRILEHYRNVTIGGWDKTRSVWAGSGAVDVYDRIGTLRIAGSGIKLGKNGLYQPDPDGWWSVMANASLGSGVAVPQSYSASKSETIVTVKMSVSFDPEKHPIVKTKIGKIEELVFLHNNVTNTKNTQCGAGNPYHASKLNAGSSPFYQGEGAIIQYDFKSNYTKCSQVPLVNLSIQPSGSEDVLRGFQSSSGVVTGDPFYSEEYIAVSAGGCSDYDYVEKIVNGDPICAGRTHESVTVAGYCEVADQKQSGNPSMGVAVGVAGDGTVPRPTSPYASPCGGLPAVYQTNGNMICTSSCTLDEYRGPTGPAGGDAYYDWPDIFDKKADCPSATDACPAYDKWSC